MGNLLNKSAYARLLSLTPSAIQAAISRGDVKPHRTGKIDPDHPTNLQYAKQVALKKKYTKRGLSDERKKQAPITNRIRELSNDMDKPEEDLDGNSDFEEYVPKTIVERLEIEKLKAQTNKLNVSVAKELNMLTLRSFVDETVRRFSTVITSYFLSMGDRIAAELAAECEIETTEFKLKIKSLIDRDVEQSLKAMKEAIRTHWAEKLGDV